MSVAENLTRWREAERVAIRGPWIAHADGLVWPNGGEAENDPAAATAFHENAHFIATSRTAMPALLAFASDVLALGHKDCPQEPDRDPYVGCRCGMDRVYRLAEQLLGGAR